MLKRIFSVCPTYGISERPYVFMGTSLSVSLAVLSCFRFIG